MKFLAGVLVLVLVSGDSAICQQSVPAPGAQTTPPAAATAKAADQPSAPPTPNTLLDGTAIKLRTTENLSSGTNKTGEQVSFEVVEEVDVQGVLVIAKGAQAQATVTNAEPKKTMGRAGKLDVHVDSVRLLDGEKAMLSATRAEKGGGHTGAMTAGMVGTAIVFFPAAPLLLFIHGKDITIPKGTEITAFVQGDMKLDMAKFAPTPAPGIAVVATVSAAPTTTAVSIEASVPNCDIELDGKFVGNSPSTLAVEAGEHTITVMKKGYADWSRTMQVSGPTAHLNAELEAKP